MAAAVHGLKPAMVMVGMQVAIAVANLLYKIAILDGMSLAVANAYRFIFSTAFMVPVAFIFERKMKNRPKLTWRVLFMAFLCGSLGGALFQNFYLESMALTSATFVTAVFNLNPAITFILGISFGLERLNLGTAGGKAKVLGTIIGIGGAMMMTFVKGVKLNIPSYQLNALHSHLHENGHMKTQNTEVGTRITGVLAGLGSCFFCSLWLVVQAKMCREYPCDYSSTALMSIMAAIQCTIFALCVERDWSRWTLGWDVRLLNVAYSGIVASGIIVIAVAWCLRIRGPLYVSAFNPLILLIVAIASTLMLNEKLYLGSVFGAVLIVCGLYMVLWGKGKEMTQAVPTKISQASEAVDIIVKSPPVDDKTTKPTSILPEDSSKLDHDVQDKDKEVAPSNV